MIWIIQNIWRDFGTEIQFARSIFKFYDQKICKNVVFFSYIFETDYFFDNLLIQFTIRKHFILSIYCSLLYIFKIKIEVKKYSFR